eukprot:gene40822-64787_t
MQTGDCLSCIRRDFAHIGQVRIRLQSTENDFGNDGPDHRRAKSSRAIPRTGGDAVDGQTRHIGFL